MKALSTTKMSSRGQIVIPEEIRNNLGLNTGHQFIVLGNKDVIILKILTEPSPDQFEMLVKEARKQARLAKLKKPAVAAAIKMARKHK